MKIRQAHMPKVHLGVLAVFFGVGAMLFAYLWTLGGGKIPLFSKSAYRVSLDMPAVANLVDNADVQMAGVKIGHIVSSTVQGRQAHVVMELQSNAPLHQGAKVVVRNKTLIDETFVQVTDGMGPAVASGSQLPMGSAKPPSDVDDLLRSLTPDVRASLAGSLQSLAVGTKDTSKSVSAALTGLGYLGDNGRQALSALAGQSADLRQLVTSMSTVFDALDTRQGQITDLVSNAQTLANVTATSQSDITSAVRELPQLLDKASAASEGLSSISSALGPVAQDLRGSAPDLSAALTELPSTSSDLRGLLPSLNTVLETVPATLQRIPDLSADAHALSPQADSALRDINPMLAYLRPYGPDIAGFFANVGVATSYRTDGNNPFTLALLGIMPTQLLSGNPINVNKLSPLLNQYNPYPRPGEMVRPGPYDGRPYPRVEREGN